MNGNANNEIEFERLVRPHLDRLYRLAFRLTRSRTDAEDLFQDVLVKAFERLQQLAGIEEAGSWLCRVMYNHFIDNRRRFARHRLLAVDPSSLRDQSVESMPGNEDPARDAELREDIMQLDSMLAKLSDEQRLVLLLHDAEGYKLSEIQSITGEPLDTLKSRLRRGRARLRDFQDKNATF